MLFTSTLVCHSFEEQKLYIVSERLHFIIVIINVTVIFKMNRAQNTGGT